MNCDMKEFEIHIGPCNIFPLQTEEVVMPYLDTFAKFRDDVRQVARINKGTVTNMSLCHGIWSSPCVIEYGRLHVPWNMVVSMCHRIWSSPCVIEYGRLHVSWNMVVSMCHGIWSPPCVLGPCSMEMSYGDPVYNGDLIIWKPCWGCRWMGLFGCMVY